MFTHDEICDILETSLKELILASYYCIEFVKDNKNWFNADRGCLGYPAAILLFAVADTIGSALAGVEEFKIPINHVKKPIGARDFERFYILNSQFYRLDLGETVIREIYESYRCLLVHNSSLLKGYFLDVGTADEIPFEVRPDVDGVSYPFRIKLRSFHRISSNAVDRFLLHAREHEDQIKQGLLAEKLNDKWRLPADYVLQSVTSSGSAIPTSATISHSGDPESTGKKRYFVDFEFKTPSGNHYWFPLFAYSVSYNEAVLLANSIETALREHYEVSSKSDPRLYIEGMTSDAIDGYAKQRLTGILSVLHTDVWCFEDIPLNAEYSFSETLAFVQLDEKTLNTGIIAKTVERHGFPVRLIQKGHLGEYKEFLLINVVFPHDKSKN